MEQHTSRNSSPESIHRDLRLYAFLAIAGKSFLLAMLSATIPERLSTGGTLITIFVTRFMAWSLFVVSLTYLAKPRAQRRLLVGIVYALSILFMLDGMFYRGFGMLPSLLDLATVRYTADMSMSVFAMLRWTDFLYLVDLPFLGWLDGPYDTGRYWRRPVRSTLVIALCGLLAFFPPAVDLGLADTRNRVLTVSPLGHHVGDVARRIEDRRQVLTEGERRRVESYLRARAEAGYADPAESPLFGSLAGRDLLLVQFESLENLVVGRTVGEEAITPVLDDLIARGLFFSNVHAQVRTGNSSDAEFMVNTSHYPLARGSAFVRYPHNTYRTLPDLLEEQGYTSEMIHGDDAEFWNRNTVYPELGYQAFWDESTFAREEEIGMAQSDALLFEESLGRLDALAAKQSPFLLNIITTTSHVPFILPEEECTLTLPEDFTEETKSYLQTIHYTDRELGRFLSHLEGQGFFDHGALILYGDHEGLSKYHPQSASADLGENEQRIPLLVYAPGAIPPGTVVDHIGGQVDIYPTIAALMGIPVEAYRPLTLGSNLLTGPGFAVLADGTVKGKPQWPWQLEAVAVSSIIVRSDYWDAGDRADTDWIGALQTP